MGSFANCHILAWALPRPRKNGIWQFLCLDCININAYTKKISKYMVEDLRWFKKLALFLLQHYFGEKKWNFASILAIICQYLSVCQILSKCYQRFKRNDHFAYWPWTDGRPYRMIIWHSKKVNLLIVQFSNPAAETISFLKLWSSLKYLI